MISLRKFSACALSWERQLQVCQFRDAIDQPRDLIAKPLGDFLVSGARILDRVMQKRRDDRRIIEALFGQDRGDGDRM